MKLFKFSPLLAFAAVVAVGPAMASDTSIIQKDEAFSQAAITVASGDIVRWGNVDDVAHNIHIKGVNNAADVDLGNQKHGEILAHKFDAKGAYRVICSIHPKMKMLVTVQ